MKKFLTVLLVIAVMFTFSFSSAFATIDWVGEETSKYLTKDTDYLAPLQEGDGRGEEGITEAYRAGLTSQAKDELKIVKANKAVNGLTDVTATKFDAPEKTKAVSLYEAYIENLKTVKTAKDAKDLRDKLVKAVGELDNKYGAYDTAMGATTATLDLGRLNGRYETEDYYLPGYGMIDRDETGLPDVAKAWLRDNDYRASDDEIKSGAKALVSALVAVTQTYSDNVKAEQGAIVDEIYKYVDKAADLRYGLPASDAEGVDAVVKKINDFEDKYAGLILKGASDAVTIDTEALEEVVKAANIDDNCLVANYLDQYYNEVSAVPEVKKLTDADKATVIALYKKVNGLLDVYEDLWDLVGVTSADLGAYAYQYSKLLKPAYEHFIDADVEAFNKLDTFTAYKMSGDKAYFDASEKNVAALKAKRTAYDALVSNYGYSDLAGVANPAYDTAVDDEALILAAEYNMGADADYDVKDNSLVQAYLNNATVKVTTAALGNTKIRVQAKIDTVSFEKILDALDEGCTVSYKFYHKTAKATAFKGPKEKDRNYITYTKLSLKKGVKYKFQCGVVIKDAQGNVVAEKSYKASTTGSRVCR